MGMTWHDGRELESLLITARPGEDGTTVSVALDRRGTLGIVAMGSGFATLLAVMFGVFALYPESPVLGVAGAVAGIGGTLAAARGYWALSTNVMDSIGQSLRQAEAQPPIENPPRDHRLDAPKVDDARTGTAAEGA